MMVAVPDDRTLLLQLERAQERLEDRVEDLLDAEMFQELRSQLENYIDIQNSDLDIKIGLLVEDQRRIQEKLDKVATNLLELVDLFVESLGRPSGA